MAVRYSFIAEHLPRYSVTWAQHSSSWLTYLHVLWGPLCPGYRTQTGGKPVRAHHELLPPTPPPPGRDTYEGFNLWAVSAASQIPQLSCEVELRRISADQSSKPGARFTDRQPQPQQSGGRFLTHGFTTCNIRVNYWKVFITTPGVL